MHRTSSLVCRLGALFVALPLALAVGLLVPLAAQAAPPFQTPTPPPPIVDPTALAGAVSAFLDLALVFVLFGGGVAYVLQLFPAWRDWQTDTSSLLQKFPSLKGLLVLALTALLGAGLSSAKVILTAEFFAAFPPWALAFVGALTVFVGSQFMYQKGFARAA